MKKLLFLMVVGFGGTMLLKGGHVTITPDNQVRVAGYTVPLPEAVQNSPVMGMITTVLMGQLQTAPQTAGATSRPGTPMPPALPNVTSAVSTYNANAASARPTQGAEQFGAAAKALR
jgi:hypothetical protein